MFFIFSCGTSRKKWVQENCNETGGYVIGKKDARLGKDINTDFLEKCPQENKEITNKGYLEGYKAEKGKDSAQVPAKEEEYKYGQDVLQDIVHAINKNPSKKCMLNGVCPCWCPLSLGVVRK
jgi:hypothetical protein